MRSPHGLWLREPAGLEGRSVDHCPNHDDPTHQEEPEDAAQDEENGCLQQASLEQLTESGNKEAGERGDDITSAALARGLGG